jgi:hypothetical protein
MDTIINYHLNFLYPNYQALMIMRNSSMDFTVHLFSQFRYQRSSVRIYFNLITVTFSVLFLFASGSPPISHHCFSATLTRGAVVDV